MAPSVLAQRRTHNLLLFQKLLNLRDGASPFTLLLDTLEQSALPVAHEFMTQAKVSAMCTFVPTSITLLPVQFAFFKTLSTVHYLIGAFVWAVRRYKRHRRWLILPRYQRRKSSSSHSRLFVSQSSQMSSSQLGKRT